MEVLSDFGLMNTCIINSAIVNSTIINCAIDNGCIINNRIINNGVSLMFFCRLESWNCRGRDCY